MMKHIPMGLKRSLFATLGLLVLLGGSIRAADKVYPKNGVPASGKISSLSPARVVINVRGKDQSYEIADVLKIAFDGEPSELERARDQFVNGQFDQALEEVKKVDLAAAPNEVIRQELLFYRWYCEGKQGLIGAGDTKRAIDELSKLASLNRKTHHLVDIFAMLGELQMAAGNLDEAVKYFTFLTKAPDALVQRNGKYQLAVIDLRKSNLPDAKSKFESLVAEKSSSPEEARIQNLARVGLATCVQQEGDPAQALKMLDDLIQKTDDSDHDLYGRIYNAQGECYQAKGSTVDALLSYLRTDLLFFTAPEPHAEALYNLKNLWPKHGNPSKAADAQKRLSTQYASSSWANKP